MARSVGLVASIEAQLERTIGAGLLPESRQLPAEQLMARRFGVSRTTVREALRRLAARGLVVQHPGRKTRVVALDESVTLENLGVALHGGSGSRLEQRRLLEGFFALKREAMVELLAACCEHASKWEKDKLEEVCFALADAARWEDLRWVELEFELLRLAARAAQRPGHLLLIQSLERAWRGIEERVLPHLDARAVSQWAYRAFHGLGEADAAALRCELPPLLRACDERVLERLAPLREVDDKPQASRGLVTETPHMETAASREALSGADLPNRSACRTGSSDVAPEEASQAESSPIDSFGITASLEGGPPHDALPLRVGTQVLRECRQEPPCQLYAGDEENQPAVAPQDGRSQGLTPCAIAEALDLDPGPN
uniref:Fibrillar collagen n=1 Tax=Aggregicoccus edonensis TaxID=1450165 RepID=A0A3Q8I1V1_9BACT|nr:fibrillar collagen [Aggregicoccus edonensis]